MGAAAADGWPHAALPALLAAERALGRLDQALKDETLRARFAADAARRETLATLHLDGSVVPWDDFLLGTIDPGQPAPELRPAVTEALSVWHTVLAAQGNALGRAVPEAGTAPAPPPKAAESSGGSRAVVEAWTAIAEAEAWLAAAATPGRAGPGGPEPVPEDCAADPPSPALPGQAAAVLQPLGIDWLALLWRRVCRSGEDLDPGLTEAERDGLGRAAAVIEDALRQPGLAGVTAALGRLHADGTLPEVRAMLHEHDGDDAPSRALRRHFAEHAPPRPVWRFVRMLAPFLLARACDLRHGPVWVSAALAREGHGYRRAAAASPAGWAEWCCGALAQGFATEIERIATLRQTQELWTRRLGARRRSSRTGLAVESLFDHPAVTVRLVQQRTATTFRGAQLIVDDLVSARILREITARRSDRVFLAEDLRQPVAWR